MSLPTLPRLSEHSIASIATIKTTCAYCGVGCGVVATVDVQACTIKVQGDTEHPANFGKLCSKGQTLGETLAPDRRVAEPMVQGVAVEWPVAIDYIAQQFMQTIADHGPDSVMLYVSGQLLTEDYYVANKLTKGFLGTNNIDSNSRLCMSTAVAGYKRAFGTDTVPCQYTDIEDSDVFIIIGSNMAWCHPILFGRLRESKRLNPDKKIVVIDPRATDSTAIADLHLPIRAGTDSHLFAGLFNYLHENGHANADYLTWCNDIAPTLEACQSFTVPHVAQMCSISETAILDFYELFARHKNVVTFYSMGVNQSSNGTDKVNSIINCHLLTGKIGYAGAGPFSITGQPNAMGGREVGALANLLTAHFELDRPEHRQTVADFWHTPAPLSTTDGIKAPDAAEAILSGKIKAIWIMATNPVVSLTQADRFAEALKQCPLVIVSDCSKDSDTLALADVVLPAQGWSEKSGTVTNSERRISRQRRLLPAFGQARPDWWIISQVAQAMGFIGFDYTHEAEIFAEYARLTGLEQPHVNQLNDGQSFNERSFNISALGQITREAYEQLTPFQWGDAHYFGLDFLRNHQGNPYNDSKRLRFIPVEPALPRSVTSADYPFGMNTGRLRDQWHTMTRTGMSATLNQHMPEPTVAIHSQDAANLGIKERDFVHIRSMHGAILVRAQINPQQRLGDVFVPIHWSAHFSAQARVGALIHNHVDPYSYQPELKFTPVALKPVIMRGCAKIWVMQGHDDAWLKALTSALVPDELGYWVRNRQPHTSEWLLATTQQGLFEEHWLKVDYWQKLLTDCMAHFPDTDTAHLEVIWFEDSAAQDVRLAIIYQQRLMAVLFVHQQEALLPHYGWLDGLFNDAILSTQTRKWLLAGRPAEGFIDVGRIVCACMGVGEHTIRDTIIKQHCKTAAEVGKHCKAGTNCGSCVSEINKILSSVSVA